MDYAPLFPFLPFARKNLFRFWRKNKNYAPPDSFEPLARKFVLNSNEGIITYARHCPAACSYRAASTSGVTDPFWL